MSFQVKKHKGHYIWLEGVVISIDFTTAGKGIIANFRGLQHKKILN
jgi:hypothetical protein